ncbi:MAG: hypothetical protein A3B30_02925 [Candidatus Komeilibacteria bacterium RIFCSPLOWO2_01_FULL_52_15]|uniref:DUF5671 domain-containing protein n=2 Tax=Candidatus Komeiliibacteriota TaxID=1817908 RepID=A0A1G2BR94_9BACT|nr:MAG: hypothetical protein A2677_02290 [Candidatus Komeilibacteria bacterium RIFCSPHIGHO2_01_FULL_52_14]OGY91641.1 MAG: hypothetical protein A3B30_02925 [Candidatus Komeilibacteria bacterium RIFCSPLOWO2_01_FULL_52_15]
MEQTQTATPNQTPVAQPRTGGAQHARNFFLYFLSFVLLYMVAVSIGGVLFYIINKTLPLVGRIATVSAGSLRYHLATLIIGTPVFLWMSWKVNRDSKADEAMRNSGLRKWLTYLTLVVAALVTIGDLIFLVYTLLGGETTLPFILKSAVILVIAGNIFYYYLSDIKFLRSGSSEARQLPRLYFNATGVLALVVIGAGLMFIESPAVQRLRGQDVARLNNLQEVDSGITFYLQTYGKLPASLDDIQVHEGATKDPVTGALFEYTEIDESNYSLCATFATSNKEITDGQDYSYPGSPWLHDAGPFCFQRNLTNILNSTTPVPLKVVPGSRS